MTNRDIQQQAARCAARHLAAGKHVEPDDAWLMWSAVHPVDGPAARLLFELEYAQRCSESRWWKLLSTLLTL
jgi:hypothetical protein